tara:strand:+ start:287 stop:442 length:156 start_codon:yes stop_codon:yes gene_type:complete
MEKNQGIRGRMKPGLSTRGLSDPLAATARWSFAGLASADVVFFAMVMRVSD